MQHLFHYTVRSPHCEPVHYNLVLTHSAMQVIVANEALEGKEVIVLNAIPLSAKDAKQWHKTLVYANKTIEESEDG